MIIDANGFQLHFEERGDGGPLLLLHGGGGSGADWHHVFTAGDPDGFRLLIPDGRGHGRSTNPLRTFTLRLAARDAFALLDHLGITYVDAIGLSLGAKTLLAAYPSRSTWAGSIFDARYAGSHPASAATAVNVIAAPASVAGSRGARP